MKMGRCTLPRVRDRRVKHHPSNDGYCMTHQHHQYTAAHNKNSTRAAVTTDRGKIDGKNIWKNKKLLQYTKIFLK